MQKFFDNFKNKYFKNWSENIHNNTSKIQYPRNDTDIKNIIINSKNIDKIIRVIGSSHSVSPIVSDNNERDIVFISLEKYNLYSKDTDTIQNIIIDNGNSTVT